jgi:colanic acid biosynthesis glycosyl transferase WcaI
MRILIYGLNYAPEPTGTGKYTGELAAWLAARGHAVEVICGLPHYPQWRLDPVYAGGRARVETLAGVRVFRVPHFVPAADGLGARARIRLESSFTLSSARYWLPRFFARSRPEVVIAVMPPMQVAVWPWLYAWLRRVPWVLHVQDLQVDAALRLGLLKGRGFGRFLYWIESFLLRRATRVSTITEAMRARVVAKGVRDGRTWLLPNWADISAVHPGPRENDFRRELGVADDAVVAMYAGNMGEKQGLEIVLQAAALCRNDPRLIFVMVGAGAARPRLEQHAAELKLPNLRFLPLQPVEKLGEMLAAGDIHLVVQRRDAADLVMPSKLANILASGRCCLATAEPGTALHEVVHGHGLGEVVPPGQAAALAAMLRRLAADRERRETCASKARAYAEQSLDKERILAAFEKRLLALARQA